MGKLLLSSALALGLATSAQATFVVLSGPDADDVKMDLNGNTKNTDEFFGSTTGNGIHSTDSVKINTTGFVDISSGFATIKPVKDGLLTQAIFTPQTGFEYDGFFTRGQLEFTQPDAKCGKSGHPACLSTPSSSALFDVFLQVNGSQTFTFQETLNNDFAFIGFDEPGENEALASLISSVKMWVDTPNISFSEIKQVMWSPCTAGGGCEVGGIPEPSTWAMFIAGFGLMGLFGWRKSAGRAKGFLRTAA